MATPRGFRFTLGQMMVATAFCAVLIAAALSEPRQSSGPWGLGSFGDPKFLLATAIRFAGAGVCLYNLRLSRGMWLVLIGHVGPWIASIATNLAITMTDPSSSAPDLSTYIALTGWAVTCLLTCLFVVGLAITFRDVRRRLAGLEGDGSGPGGGQSPG